MASRESPNPAPSDIRRRVSRRIAGVYFLFAAAWIVISDLALFKLTRDLPEFAGASLVKGGVFVLVTTALLYLYISQQLGAFKTSGASAPDDAAPARARRNPAIVFAGAATLAIALVLTMFSYESSQHRSMARNSLRAILELKADEIELLLSQRESTARAYGNARSLRAALTRLAQRPDPESVSNIRERIDELQHDLQLDAVLILDAAGRLVAGSGMKEMFRLSPEFSARAARSMAVNEPASNFLHHDAGPAGGLVLIDYITPITGTADHPGIVGAIVLRENARGRLFRLVQDWPAESASAESYLARREGKEVLFLSDLRYEKNAAFRLRRPLDDIDLPAARAAASATPVLLEGKDYRGASVVAAGRRIGGTDWFLIAKVDRDEVLAPVRRSALIWLSSIFCMTLLSAAGIAILWRQQLRLVAASELAESAGRRRAEGRLSAAEERYRALFERSLDCIFLCDLEGNFLDANRSALDLLGYRREEIPAISYRTLLDPADLPRAFEALKEVIRTGSQREPHEYTLRRKDGGRVIVESKTALVYAGDEPSAILGIARDVTERTRQQARIARLTRIRDTLSAVNRAIVHADSEDTLYGAICDVAVKHGAFVAAWIGVPDADSGMVLPLKSAGTLGALDYMRRLRISIRDVPEGRGPAGIAAREDRTVVSNDFLGENSNVPWHDAARAVGIRSSASIPLRRRGAIAAVLTVYAESAHYFDSEFQSLLEEMAGDVSFSLDVLAGDLERKRSQKELEYKNVVLSTQQETSPDAILVVNAESRIVSYNHHFLELWNIPEAMARAGNDEPVLQAVTGQMQNQEEFIQKIKYLYDNRDEKSHDELQTRDGRIVDRHSAPLFGTNGEYFGRVWYFRDISRRVKNEEARARLAAIVEASSDAIVSRGIDGKIQTWNTAAERMFGWSGQEAIGQPITLIVPPERRGELRPLIDRVVAGENLGAIESTHLRKNGSRIDTSITLSVIRDAKGDANAVSLMYRDITERKQAEAVLHETEQRFRAMIEQSISGFYMIQDNTFTYVNARFTEIFGYASANEIVGKPPSELVAPRDRATVAGNIQRRLAGEMKSISYSFTGVRKDGSEIEVGVHGSFATYGGRPVIMGLLQDISERKRAEEEIKRYVARLEQAMQSTINVVATIGELRDPYTHGHERRVGEIAAAIATEMGLDSNQVEGIRIAGYMHDVGKIAVPAEILAKPARLTKAEFELVKDHAQQSYEILKGVPFPWPVAEAAWQHHERIDGSGYPRGLKGEEIILEGRVLAVADVVEAMSSHRPYRPGLGIELALAEVEKNRGKLYDPGVADACLRLFREKAFALPA